VAEPVNKRTHQEKKMYITETLLAAKINLNMPLLF
jgi:hypothetical protein